MDKAKILRYIAQKESSSGQFRDHPMVTRGVQRGTRSVSSYGLMPTTVYEMVQRNKDLHDTPLGKAILDTQGDPEKINQITKDVSNDDSLMGNVMDDASRRLAPFMTDKDNPDAVMIYGHRRGVPAAIKAMKQGPDAYMNDPYLKEYSQPEAVAEQPEEQEAKIKALRTIALN